MLGMEAEQRKGRRLQGHDLCSLCKTSEREDELMVGLLVRQDRLPRRVNRMEMSPFNRIGKFSSCARYCEKLSASFKQGTL